jgi:hypothetical protein
MGALTLRYKCEDDFDEDPDEDDDLDEDDEDDEDVETWQVSEAIPFR